MLFNVQCMSFTVFCHLKLFVAAVLGKSPLKKKRSSISVGLTWLQKGEKKSFNKKNPKTGIFSEHEVTTLIGKKHFFEMIKCFVITEKHF